MNRRERRAQAAASRKLPPAREDGRPLYYDITPSSRVQCYYCDRNGLTMFYSYGNAFMNDPANSPDGSGDVHTVCKGHLPNNAVIYDPRTNLCRDKGGQNTWMEDKQLSEALATAELKKR
jgi:hypothetical protein